MNKVGNHGTVAWNPSAPLKEPERRALAAERANPAVMTPDKAKEVAANLQNLKIQEGQRMVEWGKIGAAVMKGTLIDTFA